MDSYFRGNDEERLVVGKSRLLSDHTRMTHLLISRRTLLGAAATLPFLHAAARAARAPDTLTFGLSSYPPTLAPWANSGTAAATIKLLIYRGLLSYDKDGKLRGELAETWQRDGDTAWVFKLRDATFQNGAPVTAEDVKWTIAQVADEKSTAYLKAEMQTVQEVQTPDPHTVRIVTEGPTATLPLWFASFHMPIIAKGSTDNNGTPVGAGPYVLKAQERGVSLDLAAFDKFYKPGLPKTKNLKVIERPVGCVEFEPRIGADRLHRLPRHVFDEIDIARLQRRGAQVFVGVDDYRPCQASTRRAAAPASCSPGSHRAPPTRHPAACFAPAASTPSRHARTPSRRCDRRRNPVISRRASATTSRGLVSGYDAPDLHGGHGAPRASRSAPDCRSAVGSACCS